MFESVKKIWRVNSSRIYLAKFAERAGKSISQGSRVLDAGAGDCPYHSYFGQACYEATDLCQVEKNYGMLSFVSNLENIPVRSDSYDLLFCSQTLEHIQNPNMVMNEFERVLKPGGFLWLTAPFYYEEHEIPYDYYRYTRYGLQHLVQQAGLTIESIEWLEGYFGTLAYQLKEAARALPVGPVEFKLGIIGWLIFVPIGIVKLSFAILSIIFTWIDMQSKYESKGHCKNYALIAFKR